MLSAVDAIRALEHALASALTSLRLDAMDFGRPILVQKAAQQAEAAFQGIASAIPSKQDASEAALAFMRGQTLAEHQYDLMASALCEPIRDRQDARVVGHGRFDGLLALYESKAKNGDLWRLTWYGLLASYFSFDPMVATESEKAGWTKLQRMLRSTWRLIDTASGKGIVPDWIKVMRSEPDLLSDSAAAKYSADYLDGRTKGVETLAQDLGIPQSSWFWHALVLGAVRKCVNLSADSEFKARIPRLLELVETRPAFRDEALKLILTRYFGCSSKEIHAQLRDFVVHKDVWRNPKLKHAGIATKWNLVTEPVWRMVLGWVNETNLKLFFELLAGRSGSDEGRLNFWARYLEQITWTRLIFGAVTIDLARRNVEIRNLITQEADAYATLTANKEVDAFMMEIGDYIIIEFSKKPNACYVYQKQGLKFDRYARRYSGGTDDLKYGYHEGAAIRISHFEDWESRAEVELKDIGIIPDRKSSTRTVAGNAGTQSARATNNIREVTSPAASMSAERAPKGARFSMQQLRDIVAKHQGARVKDSRGASGGRLWVEDPKHSGALAVLLKGWGFRWADGRQGWYFPE